MSKIKICGLFRDRDIDYVNEANPDFVGFVFAKSRRQVSIDTARKMRRELDTAISTVGVFVDADPDEIIRIYQDGIIDYIQLHGQENENYINQLKTKCGIPVIKAVRAESAEDIQKWQSSSADYLLLDNGSGGTGQAFDWNLIPDTGKPYFLAGGIHLSNLDSALQRSPYCIDVSSGAEVNGEKDRDKIIHIVRRIRNGS